MAAAVVLCIGLAQTGEAQALALGRIVVQSALGEPLRAEIDVPDINADEAASLRVGLASGEAFRAAGMDFNPALTSLQITLQRRANGSAYLSLSSARPVTEPFVDMIVEANWASGRIVRDYTLLFDPPNLRAAAPVVPLPAAVNVPPAAQALPPVAAPRAAAAPAQPALVAPAPRPRPAAPPSVTPSAPEPRAAGGGGQVQVRAGDTAGRIAAANKPSDVSLDQMLVAMLRANPKAFIGGNVNRIKSGSVIELPGSSDASTVTPGEARQIIAAQSRDFNEFRRRLAGTVPGAVVDAEDRQASGRVQAEVEDKKPVVPSQDKLTLSKGTTPAQTASEEKIAQEKQAQEASTRVAELSRNIEELAKLGTSTSAVAPSPSASPAEPPSAAVPDVALTVPAATGSAPETSPTTGAGASTETAPPAAAAPAAPPAPAPMPAPAPEALSFIDQLRDNPLVLPAAGGLLALLAGFGFYRLRQRKKGSGVDSSFLESRLQPDSFFGSSGGQRIDTAEASASGSSMVYSPSQLDAAGDVDPVAEADVYLAYGRDLQAEEILKEAMRSTPTRVAIHNKLLEIYAKRRDAKAFEVVATEAYGLTQGQGPEWDQACTLGRELDPANPLYQPGGAPAIKAGAMPVAAGGAMNTIPFGSSTLANTTGADNGGTDLDLDLDFSIDDTPSGLAPTGAPAEAAMSGLDDLNSTEALTSKAEEKAGPSSMSMDFDLDFPSEPVALETPVADEARVSQAPAGDLPTFDANEVLPDFSFDEPQPMASSMPDQDNADAEPVPAMDSQPSKPAELMSFDLNDISLDLGDQAVDASTADKGLTEESPLDTKLSLAEEFRAIGDIEGARSLAEEVLAEASGTLKTKASTFLADLV